MKRYRIDFKYLKWIHVSFEFECGALAWTPCRRLRKILRHTGRRRAKRNRKTGKIHGRAYNVIFYVVVTYFVFFSLHATFPNVFYLAWHFPHSTRRANSRGVGRSWGGSRATDVTCSEVARRRRQICMTAVLFNTHSRIFTSYLRPTDRPTYLSTGIMVFTPGQMIHAPASDNKWTRAVQAISVYWHARTHTRAHVQWYYILLCLCTYTSHDLPDRTY